MYFIGYQTVINLDNCEFFKLSIRSQESTFVEVKFVYGEGKSIEVEGNGSPINYILRFFHSSKIRDFIRHGGLPHEFSHDLRLIDENKSLDLPLFIGSGGGVISIREAIKNSVQSIALPNCRSDDHRVCEALIKYINKNETFITNEDLLKWFSNDSRMFGSFHHAIIEKKNGLYPIVKLKRLKPLEE